MNFCMIYKTPTVYSFRKYNKPNPKKKKQHKTVQKTESSQINMTILRAEK